MDSRGQYATKALEEPTLEKVIRALFDKGGLKVPKVFELGLSPLEMSVFALNRGFSRTVVNR